MRTDYSRRRLIALLLGSYFAVGVLSEFVDLLPEEDPGSRELFPVFSWSLFSYVPNEVTAFAVRILSVDGASLEPPCWFEDARPWFRRATYHDGYITIQKLGAAVVRGSDPDVATTRDFFETHFLESRAVRYEVVQRRYDALEYWRDGSIREIESVALFDSIGDR